MTKQQGQKPKRVKTIRTILNIAFLSGLILNVFSVLLFEKTIINGYQPIIWNILLSVALLPVTSGFLDKYYYTQQNVLYKLVYNMGSIGAITTYAVLALNYYLAEDHSIRQTIQIVETGTLANGRHSNCRQPFAIINYEDNQKQLIFPCGTNFNNARAVILITRDGLLGYDIITQKTLQ